MVRPQTQKEDLTGMDTFQLKNSTDSTSRKELKRKWCTAPEIFEGLIISTGYEIDASHRVSVDSNDTAPV